MAKEEYKKVYCIKDYNDVKKGEFYYLTSDPFHALENQLEDSLLGIYKLPNETVISVIHESTIKNYFIDEIKHKLNLLLDNNANRI